MTFPWARSFLFVVNLMVAVAENKSAMAKAEDKSGLVNFIELYQDLPILVTIVLVLTLFFAWLFVFYALCLYYHLCFKSR